MNAVSVLSRECRLRNIALADLSSTVLSGFWNEMPGNQRSAVKESCKLVDGLFGTNLVPSELLPNGPIGDLNGFSMPKHRKVPGIAPEFQALIDDYLNRKKTGRAKAHFGTRDRDIDTGGVTADRIKNINVAIRWFWHGLVVTGVVNAHDSLDLAKISDPVLIHDVVEACAAGHLGSPCSPDTRRGQTNAVIKFMNTTFPGYAAEIDEVFFNSVSLRSGNKDTVDRARKRAECLEFIDDIDMQREFFSTPGYFFDVAKPAIRELQALDLSKSRMLTNDQHYALELAIMAALTTIVTKFPGRLKTVHQFDIDGPNSNFSYPQKGPFKSDVLLHVPAHITKNGHFAEGVPLKKSRVVNPRQILTWYRNEALPLIVTHKVPHADLRRPNSLFGGLCIDTIRLIWRRHIAAQGLFITPHMCRHLLASLLYSHGTAIELIAELLGDKVATVENRYVFVDRIRMIREVMEVQAEIFRRLGV